MLAMIDHGQDKITATKPIWYSVVVAAVLVAGAAICINFQGWGAHRRNAPVLAGGAAPAEIERVGIDEAEAMILRPDVVSLDARPRDFYELGHLPGARCLSREEFEKTFTSIESELRRGGQKILIYCSAADCEDGEIVARALQTRQIGPLYLYPGGYDEWEAAGKPVETTP
jgi:rhodanese-related sulfurtransferase